MIEEITGDILVQEYTCTLCGYSTRKFEDLKSHMKETHDRTISDQKTDDDQIGSSPKEAEAEEKEGEKEEEGIENILTEETNDIHPGTELISKLLNNIPKDMISEIRTSGLLKCIFCERSFGSPGELIEHITNQHREEMDNITEGSEPFPMPQNFDAILGDLGKITSMLISQLGPALGGKGQNDLGKIFTGLMSQENLEDMEEMEDVDMDMELPDIKGIMEIAMEMRMDGPGDAEEEMDEGDGKKEENLVKECPGCRNFIKREHLTCPFCGYETDQ